MVEASVSYRVEIVVYSGKYELELLNTWGGPYSTLPTSISPNQSKIFHLDDNDRAGIWYRAIDPTSGEEKGLVTLSFTCPKSSSNSAEGSYQETINGIDFISAGLQKYKESGTPVTFTYKIGEENQANWGSGDSKTKSTTCDQTTFKDTRAVVILKNSSSNLLTFGNYWNDGNQRKKDCWYWEPNIADIPPQSLKRTILLKDNDRAGLYLKASNSSNDHVGFVTLSFTCPKSSSNSAEGSDDTTVKGIKLLPAGLQKYEEHGTPVIFRYNIGESNQASWSSGSKTTSTPTCPQTTFSDVRCVVNAKNTLSEPLLLNGYWNDNSGGITNWYIEPQAEDSIPVNCQRQFLLLDNDRAGLYYQTSTTEYHLSFTCPKSSSNSAEGSKNSGLQKYEEHGTPVTFTFQVGESNKACWSSGGSDDGKIVCPQTNVGAPTHSKYVDKITVYIWPFLGKDEAWGHASLAFPDPKYTKQSSYVSWWPAVPVQSKIEVIKSLPAIKGQTYEKDYQYEGSKDPLVLEITKRSPDYQSMSSWWADFYAKNEYWVAATQNCSTTVYQAIKAARILTPREDENFDSIVVWTPSDIENLVNIINK